MINMKPYDAKISQKCNICGFQISHNKQGRFTSHIKKEHNLTLEEYLIQHYYNEEDLKCTYELCDGTVGLYRGKPEKYCSRSCRSKGKPLVCVVCDNKFDTDTRPHRKTKTCSDACASKLRSVKTKAWHTSMSEEEKQTHFKGIITKTAKTRKDNKTPSWNSGKTGIYSEETIEKILQATLKQMKDQVFKKTKIEIIMEEYLQTLNVEHKYSFILQKRQFDFLLLKQNLIIECDGDYWHANPKFYPEPAEWQIERIAIDQEKNEIAKNNGYRIVRFWEDDILNNFDHVKRIIHGLLATT
jgi:very-short-patch-repair endonuclease